MLFLVRHGQCEANVAGLLLGRAESPMTELGRRQAIAVVRAIAAAATARVSKVVSSPLGRARETAEAFGIPVDLGDRWVEQDYGELDGKPLFEVPAELWSRWRSDPSYCPPGGESIARVGARVREACEELSMIAAVEDLVVVSHVSPIKAAIAWALGTPDSSVWRMFIGVGSISRIAVGERGPVLHSFNETSHLPLS